MNEKLRAALEYAAKGFPVFPCHNVVDGECSCGDATCKSKGKHPRVAKGLSEATTHKGTILSWWGRWPDANIALSFEGTRHFAVDIDTKEDADGRVWLSALNALGHDVDGLVQTTPSGGCHIVFRLEEDVFVRNSGSLLAPGVDVRGDGGYIMVEPSDHVKGVYSWEDDLREHEAPMAPKWLLDDIATAQPRRDRGKQEFFEEPMLPEERAEIEDALQYIDADCSRDKWVKVGMALHSKWSGEDGKAIWAEWSATSESHDANMPDRHGMTEIDRQWKSFTATGDIDISMLFKLAQDEGWLNVGGSAAAIMSTANVVEEEDDGEDEAPELVPWTPPEDAPGEIPEELLDGARVGVMAHFMEWCEERLNNRLPLSYMAAGLAAFGTVFGRFFAVNNYHRTNVFVLTIAKTSAGKNGGRMMAKQMLYDAGLPEMVGAEEFASGASVFSEMQKHHTQLFLVDEISKSMRANLSKNAKTHESEIMTNFMKLWSSASDSCVKGKAVLSRERVDLVQPHACIYGTSTDQIYKAFSSEQAADGFLNRCIFFDTEVFKRQPSFGRRKTDDVGRSTDDSNTTPPDLLFSLKYALDFMREHQARAGNLVGAGNQTQPYIYEIDFESDEAASYLVEESFLDYVDKLKEKAGGLGEIYSRVTDNALKLAMIRACCRWADGQGKQPEPMISMGDVKWAREIMVWSLRRLVMKCEEHFAEDFEDRDLKKLLRLVRERGPIKHGKLLGLSNMKKATAMPLIETLCERGDVKAVKKGKGVTYHAVMEAAPTEEETDT